jgi:hypothetical protein
MPQVSVRRTRDSHPAASRCTRQTTRNAGTWVGCSARHRATAAAFSPARRPHCGTTKFFSESIAHRARAPRVRTKSGHLSLIRSSATGAVFVRGVRDHQFAHGVPRLAPPGESIKDDSYGGQSHLSEVDVASRLSLNSLALGFKKISCFLQLPDKPFRFPQSR